MNEYSMVESEGNYVFRAKILGRDEIIATINSPDKDWNKMMAHVLWCKLNADEFERNGLFGIEFIRKRKVLDLIDSHIEKYDELKSPRHGKYLSENAFEVLNNLKEELIK